MSVALSRVVALAALSWMGQSVPLQGQVQGGLSTTHRDLLSPVVGVGAEGVPEYCYKCWDPCPCPDLLPTCCGTTARVEALGTEGWTNTTTAGVEDYDGNPILTAADDLAEWLLGDPAVVVIGDTIHLWGNEVFHGIIHYTAPLDDPFAFTKLETSVHMPGSVRAFAVHDEAKGSIVLYYEQYELRTLEQSSKLVWIESAVPSDGSGWSWSRPTVALEPELDWEMVGTSRVGNAFVYQDSSGGDAPWHLYYSASSVHLPDSNVDEPIYQGSASSQSLRGPWTRDSDKPLPVAKGSLPDTMEILGVGSIKLVPPQLVDQLGFEAMCNRVFLDTTTNTTGSTIATLRTASDGDGWDVVDPWEIPPEADVEGSWKRAYVYGFTTLEDPTTEDPSELWVYYNARDGWEHAREAIGVSRIRF